jgi:hypothetical protein
MSQLGNRLIVTGNNYFLTRRQTCDQFGQMGLGLFKCLLVIIAHLIAPRQRRRAINPRPARHASRTASKTVLKNNLLGAVAAPVKMNLGMNCARNRWRKTE